MSEPRRSQRRNRSGNPAVRAGAEPAKPQRAAKPAGPARAGVERRSRPLLMRLNALPRWLVLVVALAFVVAGLAVPGIVGGLLLLVFAALLGWLLALSWPILGPLARAARVVLLTALLAYAVAKLLGVR